MPQIKKKKVNASLAGGIIAVGAGTVMGGQSASADEVDVNALTTEVSGTGTVGTASVDPTTETTEVVDNTQQVQPTSVDDSTISSRAMAIGTEAGAGQTVYEDDTNQPNQSVINLINSQIRNLQVSSNGIVQISGTPKILTTTDVEKTQESITKLSALIQQYNDLKAKLDAQNATNESMNGMAGADNTQTVTGGTLDQTANNLQSLIDQMNDMVNSNNDIINENANHSSEGNALTEIVKNHNKTITDSASDLKHYKDGILGDLDDINRKSQDSEKADGIVVDNSETQKVNTVTTTATVDPNKKQVSTVAQADQELERILGDIANQNKTNMQQALDAADYRANALANIDDINVWLSEQKAAAEEAKKKAEDATTSIKKMDEYKASMLKQLNEALEILKSNGSSQKMIDQVQKAIDQVNASGLDKIPLPPVGQKEPIEFGDIGQTQTTPNGAQDETIANTKQTQAEKLAAAIKEGVAKVEASNQAAMNAITPSIDKNSKAMANYLEKIKNGGSGSQIDESYLNKMPIYTTNDTTAIRNFYQNYIKTALAQTEEDVSALDKYIDNADRINHVPSNTSIAQLSAAIYAANAQTMDDGFGSVMLKSTNINSLISTNNIAVQSGATIYANSLTDGGAQNVYNALLNMPGGSNADYSQLPALKDLYGQYLHPAGSSDPSHAANTLTIVTNSPSLRLTLPDSFVYTDENGNTGAAATQIIISATAYDGSDLSAGLQKVSATDSGSYAMYVYNFQINPYTGQLVAGVSYIAMQNPFEGEGNAVANTGGGGEFAMGLGMVDLDTLSAEQKMSRDTNANAMDLGFNAIGAPIDQVAANGLGLAQSIRVAVDPNNAQASKYAKYAPLYVSDIDDGQELIAYTGSNSGKGPKIITNDSAGSQNSISNWSNPYGQTGQAFGVISKNKDTTTGTTQKTTNMDDQSAVIFNVAGNNNELGLTNTRVTMRSQGDASNGYNYMSIDTALFAPFGIIGQPSISLDQINADVNTLEVNIPKAKAETKGSYELSSNLEYMYSGTFSPGTPENISGELKLPTFIAGTGEDKLASSNTSMVVNKKGETDNLTSSGNSLVIQQLAKQNSTASGGSLVIRSNTTSTSTASGGSLVIRTAEPVAVASGSGNSLTVQSLADAIKNSDASAEQVSKSAPVMTTNADGTHNLAMSIYVDPALVGEAQSALDEWAKALELQGVTLDTTITTDINQLRDGVTLAILECDNSNELLSSNQFANDTINGLGGLASKIENVVLTPDGYNDVYNKTGTVTAGDVLKNSMFTIQLNTEGLSTQKFKDALMGGTLVQSVLKHEIGHIFGLRHDDLDELMTPYVSDSSFKGTIGDDLARKAADSLIKDAANPDNFKIVSPTAEAAVTL